MHRFAVILFPFVLFGADISGKLVSGITGSEQVIRTSVKVDAGVSYVCEATQGRPLKAVCRVVSSPNGGAAFEQLETPLFAFFNNKIITVGDRIPSKSVITLVPPEEKKSTLTNSSP